MQFEVYKDGDNFYIDYYVAVAFGVGDLLDTVNISSRVFVKANKLDIDTLVEISKNTDTIYEPVYFNLNIPAIKAKEEVQFEVYDEDGTYYIDYYVAVAFGIELSGESRIIGNREFVKVTEKEISNLMELSKLTDNTYIPVVFKLQKTHSSKDDIETVEFEVYRKDDNYLVDYIVAVSFAVGDPSKLQKIGNRTFVEISKDELDNIIDYSNQTDTPYVPHYFNALDNKQVAKLIIYKDENNELYIASNAADVLGIKLLCLENIKPNELHSKISKEDLNRIIESGKEIGIEIQPEYVDLEKKEKKHNHTDELVILEAYKNIETGELYLEDGVCAYCDIGNREQATYVNGKRCYKVQENELSIAANMLNATAVTKYFELEKTEIHEERKEPEEQKQTITILSAKSGFYLNQSICENNNIYSNKEKIINNNNYFKINQNNIDRLRSKYNIEYKELPQKEAQFIVCTLDDKVYVEEYIANLFKYQSIGHKIRIEGKIYYEVTQEQVDKIVNITSTLDTKLEPMYRGIKLKSKKQEGIKSDIFEEDDYSDELIPGTNIYKPRYRRPEESLEDYEYFLTRYYLTFFPNAKLPSKYRLKKEEIIQDTNTNRVR